MTRLRIPPIATLPPALAERQGELWRLRGDADTPGSVWTCLNDGTGNHAWIAVDTAAVSGDVDRIDAAVNTILRHQIYISAHGAIGDGSSHPLSERYTTLAEAQAVYPHATALTEEIDWAAMVSAIADAPNSVAGYGGADVIFDVPLPVVNRQIRCQTHGLRLRGTGAFGTTVIALEGATSPLFLWKIDNTIYRGPQMLDMLIDMTALDADAIHVESPYDHALMRNVYVFGLRENRRGWYVHRTAGAVPDVGQNMIFDGTLGVGAIHEGVDYTGVVYDLNDLNECVFINPTAGGHNEAAGTGFRIDSCCGVTFVNPAVGLMGRAFELAATNRATQGITIETPTIESCDQSVWAEGNATNQIIRFTIRSIRPEFATAQGAGPIELRHTILAHIDVGESSVGVNEDATCSQSHIISGVSSNVVSNGANSSVVVWANSVVPVMIMNGVGRRYNSAASTPGNIIGNEVVYDKDGNVLGYSPLYDTFS